MTIAFAETREEKATADWTASNIDAQVARADGRHAKLTKASETRIVKPRFLDYPLIPCGVITIVSGDSGASKSTLTLTRGALATRGELEGDYKGTPSNICFSAPEDNFAMQKARLFAAGADLDRVSFLSMTNTVNGHTVDTGMRIPEDLPEIRELLEAEDIRLWIIDPITSCIAGNTDKEDDVRAALDPLAALASDLDIAIIGIRHFNKGTGRASYKVSGSHAFRDAVRSLILVAKDSDSGDVVATIDKSNYTTAEGQSYSYALTSFDMTDDDGNTMSVPRITGFMPSKRTVGEIINRDYAQSETNGHADRGEVLEWLTDYLADGPASFKDIQDAARSEGFTAKQLSNARERSKGGIVSVKDATYQGRGQRRLWALAE